MKRTCAPPPSVCCRPTRSVTTRATRVTACSPSGHRAGRRAARPYRRHAARGAAGRQAGPGRGAAGRRSQPAAGGRRRAAGLPEPQAKWNGARLEITPPDEPEQARRLARVIEEFNPTHLRVATLLPATPAAAPRRAVATTVPFAIRSVMGGAQPFVVLGDGTSWFPAAPTGSTAWSRSTTARSHSTDPPTPSSAADARSLIQETAHGHSRATHHRSGRTAGRAAGPLCS